MATPTTTRSTRLSLAWILTRVPVLKSCVCKTISKTERPRLLLVPTLSAPDLRPEACSANPLNSSRPGSSAQASLLLPALELELVRVCLANQLSLQVRLLSVNLSRAPDSVLQLLAVVSLARTTRAAGPAYSASSLSNNLNSNLVVFSVSKISRAADCSVNPARRGRLGGSSARRLALLPLEVDFSVNSSRPLSRPLQVRFRSAQTTRTKPSPPLEGLGLVVSVAERCLRGLLGPDRFVNLSSRYHYEHVWSTGCYGGFNWIWVRSE